MNILITGGAGFIGSNLGSKLLTKGHAVRFLDNLSHGYKKNLTLSHTRSSFTKMDIRSRNITKVFADIDILFHFAAISSLPQCQNNPKEAYEVNVTGTANILEAARQNNIKRVIFSSTAGVYENERTFPTPELATVNPTLIYSLSKKHAEDLCRSYQQLYGMDIVILRFFNIYGPHMDTKRPNPPVVSYIIQCLLHKKQPILHSDGNQKRDMIYVDDVVKLCQLVLASSKVKNQTLNVGSGHAYTIQHIYDEIASQMDREPISPLYESSETLWNKYPALFVGKLPFQRKFVEKETNKATLASIRLAKKLLHWTPMINLHDGIQKTIRHEMSFRR